LASRRPILAVGGSAGVLTDLLAETNAGIHALSNDEIRDFLLRSYAEFRQHGHVAYRGSESSIDRYSHREMAKRFSEALDTTVGNWERSCVNGRRYRASNLYQVSGECLLPEGENDV
jgi:hypothetical protein